MGTGEYALDDSYFYPRRGHGADAGLELSGCRRALCGGSEGRMGGREGGREGFGGQGDGYGGSVCKREGGGTRTGAAGAAGGLLGGLRAGICVVAFIWPGGEEEGGKEGVWRAAAAAVV